MEAHIIQNIIKLLDRTTISGAEVQAFNEAKTALIKEFQKLTPIKDEQVSEEEAKVGDKVQEGDTPKGKQPVEAGK